MLGLGLHLKLQGHRVALFGYRVRRHPFEEICERFIDRVRWVRDTEEPGGGGEYAIVGHSLGGLIARGASPRLPEGFSRLAMLGPPNSSPALARAGRRSKLYRAATQDAGHQLGEHHFFASLPVPKVPTLVIAGDGGPRAPWLPYRGPGPSDGIVSVDETRLDGAEHRVLPVNHTFMMMDHRAVRVVGDFLRE